MIPKQKPDSAEIFIDMLCRERLSQDFELASIAHNALYALRVQGLPLDAVKERYQKAISEYIRNHTWD